MSLRLIRMPEVTRRVGLGKTAIYRLIQHGKFPAPIKVGRVSGWVEQEVDRWLAGLVAAQRT